VKRGISIVDLWRWTEGQMLLWIENVGTDRWTDPTLLLPEGVTDQNFKEPGDCTIDYLNRAVQQQYLLAQSKNGLIMCEQHIFLATWFDINADNNHEDIGISIGSYLFHQKTV
jgi:hypothetical protein